MATLNGIEPAAAELGGPAFELVCLGAGFSEESRIFFGGQQAQTVFVSDSELSTEIDPSLDWGEGTVAVRVDDSEKIDFTFTAAPYEPPPDLLEELKKGNLQALEGATDEEMRTIKTEYEQWAEQSALDAKKQHEATVAAIQGELGRRDLSADG